MADPLSIVSSVIGVTAASISLAKQLYNIADQYGGVVNDISVIASDLNGLSVVLDEVEEKLSKPNSQRAPSDKLISAIKQVIQTCEILFKDINRMIAKAQRSNSRMSKIKSRIHWVFRKSRVDGIQAVLNGQKSTLNLMLQILRDDESELHRVILDNLLRQYEHSLKVLASFEQDNVVMSSKEKIRSSKSGESNQSTIYLPRAVPSEGSSVQSVMRVLSNAVPRRNHEPYDSNAPYQNYEPITQSEPSNHRSEQPTSESSSGVYHIRPKDNNPLRNPTNTVGTHAPMQTKNDIDLLLSNWIQCPSYSSQKSIPLYESPQVEMPHPPTNPTSAQNAEDTVKQTYEEIGSEIKENITSRLHFLEKEHEIVLSEIKLHPSTVEAEVASRLKLASSESEHRLKALLEELEQANEKKRLDVEKRLLKCEADEERRKSLEAELGRCRQEYVSRMRDQTSQTRDALGRQIQNLQDRLAHDRVELGNLTQIRKDLLQELKAIQKQHEDQIERQKEEHFQDVNKLQHEITSSIEADGRIKLQQLNSKKVEVEEALKCSKDDLWKLEQEESANTSKIVPIPLAPYKKLIDQQADSRRQFKVPDWLNEHNLEGDLDSDDEDISSGYSDKISVDPSRVEPPLATLPTEHQSPIELPTSQSESPQPQNFSASFQRPPFPTVESSHSSETTSPRASTSAHHTTPSTSMTGQEPLEPEMQPKDPLITAALTTTCHRPAWKPPLVYLSGTNTLSSVLRQSTHQILYFKASQDAYHFFLSSSLTPFYIVELVPADLTTHQTSMIEWTIVPKIWASKEALTASRYVFEEDIFGQVWIKKELNWHQILQLLDFSCGVLDNRLYSASRNILDKRAEEREQHSTTQATARLFSRMRGMKEIKVLEELHGGFFDRRY